MIDPLSVSASIAGLVSLTGAVFGQTFKYVRHVKDAPENRLKLSSEFGILYGLLSRLHLIACQLEGEISDPTIQIHHVHACRQTLEKAELLLKKYDTVLDPSRSIKAL